MITAKTFYAMLRRIDGTRFHDATIEAPDRATASHNYRPGYGFGFILLESPPPFENPSAKYLRFFKGDSPS